MKKMKKNMKIGLIVLGAVVVVALALWLILSLSDDNAAGNAWYDTVKEWFVPKVTCDCSKGTIPTGCSAACAGSVNVDQ